MGIHLVRCFLDLLCLHRLAAVAEGLQAEGCTQPAGGQEGRSADECCWFRTELNRGPCSVQVVASKGEWYHQLRARFNNDS